MVIASEGCELRPATINVESPPLERWLPVAPLDSWLTWAGAPSRRFVLCTCRLIYHSSDGKALRALSPFAPDLETVRRYAPTAILRIDSTVLCSRSHLIVRCFLQSLLSKLARQYAAMQS